ncbi:DUF5086 family protein [Shewanella oneidensis]|uniref:Uncharacterized protein n=1 Tax=Shewanella oneidensis (strain ATCC 700550 / JCM 31522 / CIP 106686 / LMG 19005 / NCIMB 14063 / MR-1) TaxID=211586 RepID=Q0KHM3_SHEON|nr:DUF5086 family protein [Shewanella oneidensis]ABI26436.1 hypothetical protein SO_A0184 [Shewanella oneidensis MR-1]MDX5999812.1 DUF5086 family protein [Shewanella oneidensis]MEE2030405.1 hypothetical protein [Shewanella oneidensis]
MLRKFSLITYFLASTVLASDVGDHKAGIWSIESAQDMTRWIIIHNIESDANTAVFHIEVIGRKHGHAVWQIERLVHHMAITEKALKASVKIPLKSGAVYPESFNHAYLSWQKENNGMGGAICDTSVIECF